jgi:hypothetical protein
MSLPRSLCRCFLPLLLLCRCRCFLLLLCSFNSLPHPLQFPAPFALDVSRFDSPLPADLPGPRLNLSKPPDRTLSLTPLPTVREWEKTQPAWPLKCHSVLFSSTWDEHLPKRWSW